MSQPPPLSEEEQGLLLQRLLQGEANAPQDLCVALADWLFNEVRCAHRDVHPDFVLDAVHQTLFELCKKPERYDPGKLGLASYLVMSADRDVRNLLRKERRHTRRRVSWNVVEDAVEQGKYSEGEDNPLEHLVDKEQAQAFKAKLELLTRDWRDEEKRVLGLMSEGERRCEVFAEALGLAGRPSAEQEHEVKKVKDRIKIRLKREGLSLG